MDLSIETLAGTSFDLRVSPYETVMGVKVKIQRLEGIPVSQQHLIWRSMELKDDHCLNDYSISNGSTLKLVLAMRGGPINTRRVSVEDPTLREVTEYMEANRDEIWDKLIRDDNQVTLLVFREGDQLNFYRVYDRGDGTVTPLSDSCSPSSLIGVHGDETVEDSDDENALTDNQRENEMIRRKLSSLRHKMAVAKKAPHLNQQEYVPRPPTSEKPDSVSRRIAFTPMGSDLPSGMSSQASVCSRGGLPNETSQDPLPPRTRNMSLMSTTQRRYTECRARRYAEGMQSNPTAKGDEDVFTQQACSSVKRSPLLQPMPSIGQEFKSVKTSPMPRTDSSSSSSHSPKDHAPSHNGGIHVSHAHQRSPRRAVVRRVVELVPSDPIVMGEETPSKRELKGTKLTIPKDGSLPLQSFSNDYTQDVSRSFLPPVVTHSADQTTSKKRQRCIACRRRLGLATTFKCRCGDNFCGIHRYPETHQCSFDYKAEGRKVLQRNNPVVAAPKLPKI